MKNIEAILKEAGLEVTDEQLKTINDGVKENYKTINEYQGKVDKIKSLEDSVKETQEALKKFDGVDAEALNKQIKELNDTIEKNKADYDKQIADRDFSDIIDKAISSANGKNAKAIKALLDIETLRGSKNQQADIEKAIKDLTEAEDSKMLFGEAEPKKAGSGNPIGQVQKQGSGEQLTMHSAIAEYYNN